MNSTRDDVVKDRVEEEDHLVEVGHVVLEPEHVLQTSI